jgi:hypothetical protein
VATEGLTGYAADLARGVPTLGLWHGCRGLWHACEGLWHACEGLWHACEGLWP